MSRGLYYPIQIVQGETLELPFDIQEGGEFITFTDATFVGHVRNSNANQVAAFIFAEHDEDADIIVASISSTDTGTIPSGDYGFEIRMTHNDKVSSVFYGSFDVSPTLTTLTTGFGQPLSVAGSPTQTSDGMFRPIT